MSNATDSSGAQRRASNGNQQRSQPRQRAPRKQVALREQTDLKKITIYIDRVADAMLESACTNRQLMTGEGAHVHTKSALIGEIIRNEFIASYQQFGDYVSTTERLRQAGWLPSDAFPPPTQPPQQRRGQDIAAPRVDLPPPERLAGRRGAKKREE